jgi:hypothetical protein
MRWAWSMGSACTPRVVPGWDSLPRNRLAVTPREPSAIQPSPSRSLYPELVEWS